MTNTKTMAKFLIVWVFAAVQLFGAFAATTEWDIRTTGAADNGGGFNTASSGTDYSQQDAPQVTYTDLVIDAVTATNITSAATPFTGAHVGNVINITSGTGFTVQRVQVVSVLAGVATCDKAVGSTGSTGGNGKLGGALVDPENAALLMVARNVAHVKSGTYSKVTTRVFSPNALTWRLVGYNVTHYDGGTRPVLTSSTNSVNLLEIAGTGGSGASTGTGIVENIAFTHTAATRGYGIASSASGYGPHLTVSGCTFDGLAYAVWSVYGATYNFLQITLFNTEIKNSTQDGVLFTPAGFLYWSQLDVIASWIHDNAGSGINFTNFPGGRIFVRTSIISDNGAGGIYAPGSIGTINIWQSVLANNTTFGVYVVTAAEEFMVADSIIYGNSTYGINVPVGTSECLNQNNAYGANGTADRNNWTAGANVVALSADPFTSSTNFSLNATAGGGAAAKQTGFPGAFIGSSGTGYLDIGAVQSSGGSAPATLAYPLLQ